MWVSICTLSSLLASTINFGIFFFGGKILSAMLCATVQVIAGCSKSPSHAWPKYNSRLLLLP